MPIQEIFMDFDADDNAVISVKGVAGKSCKDLTADLERQLGTVIDEKHTEEYNKTAVKNVQKISQK